MFVDRLGFIWNMKTFLTQGHITWVRRLAPKNSANTVLLHEAKELSYPWTNESGIDSEMGLRLASSTHVQRLVAQIAMPATIN